MQEIWCRCCGLLCIVLQGVCLEQFELFLFSSTCKLILETVLRSSWVWIRSYFSLHHQRYLLRTENDYVGMNIHVWHSQVGVAIWCELVAFDCLWIFISTCLNVGLLVIVITWLQFQVKSERLAVVMHWSGLPLVDHRQFPPLIYILLMCRY